MNETPVSSPVAEFSAAQAVAAGTDFAELKASADGLFWIEFRPADGACRIWHWLYHQARCLTPDGFSVRSRVYEYGGGSFCLGGDGLVFVNEKDQQVYTQPLDDSQPRALTEDASCRYGDVQWHDGQLLAVEERHAEQVEHRLVALSESGRVVLAEGADFYASPTVSADGMRLAWIEWNRPAQPWTITRLMCRARDSSSQWGPVQCIASNDESLQQPRFDAEGRLYCLSDRNGFWQPWGKSMATGRRCLPRLPTMLLRPGNWVPVPGWHWGRKAIWRVGSKTASGNWGCVTPMGAWSVSPVATRAFAAWPWTAITFMPLPPRPSARLQ